MPQPLFIVGAPRSGTELVRGLLNAHPSVMIAEETHYFEDLRPRIDPTRPPRPYDLDYFLRLQHRKYGHGGDAGLAPMSREALVAAIGVRHDVDGLFEAHCRLNCGPKIRIWGEKTPRHAFRINEMLATFPQARILVMVRDPRAVIASYRDWHLRWLDHIGADGGNNPLLRLEQSRVRRSYSITLLALLWNAVLQNARAAQLRWGRHRVRIQRYEDIVGQKTVELNAITEWLDVKPYEAMPAARVVNSSYANVDGTGGFSEAVANRWKTSLTPPESRHVELIAHRGMQSLHYPPSDQPIDFLFHRKVACFGTI